MGDVLRARNWVFDGAGMMVALVDQPGRNPSLGWTLWKCERLPAQMWVQVGCEDVAHGLGEV